jgi:glutamine amidotransferase PdxT
VIPVAYYKNDPVMVTNGLHYATSFHPEIGNDHRVHEYIINNLNEK